MKKIVIFLLSIFSLNFLNAQSIIGSWDFSDTNMIGVSIYNGNIYGHNWQRMTDTLMGTGNDGYMRVNLYNSDNQAFLEFPSIEIPSNHGMIEIRFKQIFLQDEAYGTSCYVEYYSDNSWQSIGVNKYDDISNRFGPDSISIVLPFQATLEDSLKIRFKCSNYSAHSNYWAIDDVEIVTPPDLSAYILNINRTNSTIRIDGNTFCANDTVMYERTPASVLIIPDLGYRVQSVFLDSIDVTSDLIGLGSGPSYITNSIVNCNMDIIPYHTACWIFNMPIDANHTFEVNTVTMPNVNISINCAGLVSGVDVNGIPTCNSSVSSIYGSHDTIIIHTQAGSMKPKIFQTIDTTTTERSCYKINDTTYRIILYSVSSNHTFTITASPQPQIGFVNENGGYIYAFIYNDNNQIEIDNIHDTVIGVPYENAVAQVRFVTFLPNCENTNLYVNDTNAHRLVRLYLDGIEIALDSVTDYFTITQYSDAIEYILTVNMDSSHSIIAIYGNYYIRFTATGTSEDEEKGSVSGSGIYPVGTEVIFNASANYGYHFDHWNDGNTDNPRTLILNNDTTITAFFSPNSYLISTSSNDESKGTVSSGGYYDYNTSQILYAEPTEGHHFVYWMDGNTDNPRTIQVFGDSLYTAFFAIDTLTVNVTSNNIVYGNVTGSGEYVFGSPCTIEAMPYSGYVFVRWSNGVTYNPYTFAVLTNMDIEAVFAPEGSIHNVSVQVQPAGTGTVTGDGPYATGETITLEALPNDGWHFVRWQDNNTDNPRNFVVYADMAFTAFFESDDTQGIGSIEDGGIRIWSTLGNIVIEGCKDKIVSVYDMIGRRVASTKAEADIIRIAVPSGVYLIKADLMPARKVVVVR